MDSSTPCSAPAGSDSLPGYWDTFASVRDIAQRPCLHFAFASPHGAGLKVNLEAAVAASAPGVVVQLLRFDRLY